MKGLFTPKAYFARKFGTCLLLRVGNTGFQMIPSTRKKGVSSSQSTILEPALTFSTFRHYFRTHGKLLLTKGAGVGGSGWEEEEGGVLLLADLKFRNRETRLCAPKRADKKINTLADQSGKKTSPGYLMFFDVLVPRGIVTDTLLGMHLLWLLLLLFMLLLLLHPALLLLSVPVLPHPDGVGLHGQPLQLVGKLRVVRRDLDAGGRDDRLAVGLQTGLARVVGGGRSGRWLRGKVVVVLLVLLVFKKGLREAAARGPRNGVDNHVREGPVGSDVFAAG